MQQIDNRDQLRKFATKHGLREDWHEPDEQEVSAYFIGNSLDNAMGSASSPHNHGELNVILTHRGKNVAVVNLATLLSWAAS